MVQHDCQNEILMHKENICQIETTTSRHYLLQMALCFQFSGKTSTRKANKKENLNKRQQQNAPSPVALQSYMYKYPDTIQNKKKNIVFH
jgi:hypothetical protein